MPANGHVGVSVTLVEFGDDPALTIDIGMSRMIGKEEGCQDWVEDSMVPNCGLYSLVAPATQDSIYTNK